ncbi:type III secretion system chaperone [Halodesulfovibrio spirochaetisodalis]|uniref:Molecular chaperone Tir n=1 Tax=Halodesulfovibrio spirochaetisodalis TaxID=1560234 RepID=A0A1B7XDA0_9BACT|nr:type III secretion system chaperone [Halodesulfovibrio spirochaetisodalis]OBQ51911.1 hypothetical protein SP90_08765 [Halodesulfovibrio spirochaetisodalis]
MDSTNYISELIEQLGFSLELEELELDENNFCSVDVQNITILLQWEEKTQRLLLSSAVGELGEGHFQEFAVKLLQANYVWNDTRGASLALDADAELIVLCQWVDVRCLEYPAFYDAFEVFVNLTRNWKDALPELFESTAQSVENESIPTDAYAIRI